MDFTRNHYLMAGLIILLFGVQLRMVDSYVLNEKVTNFIHEKLNKDDTPVAQAQQYLQALGPAPRKTVRPPAWLGWALMSVGSVLVLHSLAMKGPGG